jgi:uncharacterized protein
VKSKFLLFLAFALAVSIPATGAAQNKFSVLALYSTDTERDHVDFAEQAVQFYGDLAKKDDFTFKASTNWDDLKAVTPSQYQVVLWFNDLPHTAEQRAAFEHYMEAGGAWIGYHAAGYNDRSTNWPWFVHFLGVVFYGNNWPPLPATLIVDGKQHPATHRLPATYLAPANEWYSWQPNPRANKDIQVLLTLSPANYPLGLKDTITSGDVPVAWTNTKYKMVYMNMGHGDKIFTSPTQNLMLEDTLLWLGGRR